MQSKIGKLVRAIGGKLEDIHETFGNELFYRLVDGDLDIRITGTEDNVPWVDAYHAEHGPVAIFRSTDISLAADWIEDVRGLYGAKAGVPN